jgi:hypothetical protein
MINYLLLKNIIAELRDDKFYLLSVIWSVDAIKANWIIWMPQLEVNTNQKNTHWTWAERTYGRQQQIIWAVFFQTNYIAQTLVKETRDNIADLIIWTTSS